MRKKIQHALWILMSISSLQFAMTQVTCSPVLAYNSSYDLCAGSGVLEMTVSVGIPAGCAFANPNVPFNWIGPNAPGGSDDNTISITNPDEGDYFVQINLQQSLLPGAPNCPCQGAFNSNIITVNSVPDEPNVTSGNIICGGSTVLTALPPLNASGSGFFNWYDNSNNLIFSGNSYTTGVLNATTDFEVSYVENGCESSKEDFSVVVNPLPQPLIGPDTINTNCASSVTLSANSPSSDVIHWYADQNLTNLVYIGSQFTTPALLSTRTYYAVNVNGTCQSAEEAIVVNVFPTAAPNPDDLQACTGDEVTLTADHGVGNLGEGLFQWYDVSNNLLYVGEQFELPSSYTENPGIFTFYVAENINGCSSTLSTQTLQVNGLPDVILDTSFIKRCEQTDFNLFASSSFSPVNYSWLAPNGMTYTSQSISITDADKGEDEGNYQVTVQNGLTGCISNPSTVYVQVVAAPNLGLLDEYIIWDGEVLQLTASGADSYTWTPDSYFDNSHIANPVFTPAPLPSGFEETVIVEVVGEDLDNSCTATTEVTIIVKPFDGKGELPIKVYDLFTPNADGFNDFWYIDFLYNLDEYEISVFDKSNKLVYHHDSSTGSYDANRWNGGQANDASKLLPTGTYRFVIHAPGSGNVEPLRGQVTLLR